MMPLDSTYQWGPVAQVFREAYEKELEKCKQELADLFLPSLRRLDLTWLALLRIDTGFDPSALDVARFFAAGGVWPIFTDIDGMEPMEDDYKNDDQTD
jgi:hypothetical protein